MQNINRDTANIPECLTSPCWGRRRRHHHYCYAGWWSTQWSYHLGFVERRRLHHRIANLDHSGIAEVGTDESCLHLLASLILHRTAHGHGCAVVNHGNALHFSTNFDLSHKQTILIVNNSRKFKSTAKFGHNSPISKPFAELFRFRWKILVKIYQNFVCLGFLCDFQLSGSGKSVKRIFVFR